MKKIVVLILALTILVYSEANFKKGEVLVKTKDIDTEVIMLTGEEFGLLSQKLLYEEEGVSTWLLKFPTDSDIFEIIEAYKDNPDVLYAEPNYIRTILNKKQEKDVLKDTPLTLSNEPGILEVQEMTIKYADVHSDKIKKLRKACKYKTFFPKISLSFDKDTGPYWYSGNYLGDKKDEGISLDFTWELSDLIYDSGELSIDERSRVMVRLRNEILQDVTKLYFERKRLIIENKEKNAIKIEELTALIDGYTGGGFSKKIKH